MTLLLWGTFVLAGHLYCTSDADQVCQPREAPVHCEQHAESQKPVLPACPHRCLIGLTGTPAGDLHLEPNGCRQEETVGFWAPSGPRDLCSCGFGSWGMDNAVRSCAQSRCKHGSASDNKDIAKIQCHETTSNDLKVVKPENM